MCPYVGNATTRKTFTLRSENDDSSRNQDVFFDKWKYYKSMSDFMYDDYNDHIYDTLNMFCNSPYTLFRNKSDNIYRENNFPNS